MAKKQRKVIAFVKVKITLTLDEGENADLAVEDVITDLEEGIGPAPAEVEYVDYKVESDELVRG